MVQSGSGDKWSHSWILKYLGVVFDSILLWNSQLEEVKERAKSFNGMHLLYCNQGIMDLGWLSDTMATRHVLDAPVEA
jgi:hypothetical protein